MATQRFAPAAARPTMRSPPSRLTLCYSLGDLAGPRALFLGDVADEAHGGRLQKGKEVSCTEDLSVTHRLLSCSDVFPDL